MTGSTEGHSYVGAPPLELACLDMAGTTVVDDGLVEVAFATALDRLGAPTSGAARARMDEHVRATMGTSKIEVFRALFAADEERAHAANDAFEHAYAELISAARVRPVPGAVEAIAALRGAGVRVALTTGFSAGTRQLLIRALGWETVVDLAVSPGDAGRGRPFPDMVLSTVLRLGVSDVRAVAVVGDTPADIVAGLRAGAPWVVGVESGATAADELWAAGATHVIRSVATLPVLLAPVLTSP